MTEPEAIHDRRDVVGTLPEVVLPRALAQRVTHESLGFCSWRSESERCMEQRRLIAELNAALVEGV